MPKYPDIVVPMLGEDGNAFAVMGRAKRAIQRSGLDREERKRVLDEYMAEAMSGDYDHLLATTMDYFEVE
jgi:hypothetical protein